MEVAHRDGVEGPSAGPGRGEHLCEQGERVVAGRGQGLAGRHGPVEAGESSTAARVSAATAPSA
ncbi:hypothetical protein, partial [Streptomyces shenzhenensis]|uniref:hypothetical protein n=1 Tax=Streptomyces shenzhenensis TaxID=943815 RepID=UPI001C687854